MNFYASLQRFAHLDGTKKCIVSREGFLEDNGINFDPAINRVNQSEAFPVGSPVIVKNFCVFTRELEIAEPDLQFRNGLTAEHKPTYLVGEVVAFQKIWNGKLSWFREHDIPTHFHVKRLFVIVGVVDSILNMACYKSKYPENIKLGLLSENAIGFKHSFYVVGQPLPIFAGAYARWNGMSVNVASLVDATHTINRRPSSYDVYRSYMSLASWPIDNERYMKYGIDKAIQITAMGYYRGKTGTRIVGRKIKRNKTVRQRSVCIFDSKAVTLGYRNNELANIRRLSTKDVELMYGIR